jgi:GWxTD domain-containing protein
VAFDAARGADRVGFLRRFWTLRDRRDLRGEGARLSEHFRRRTYAEQHFPLLTNRRSSSIDDIYRTATVPFDDRGMIYLRQGTPDQTISVPVAGMQPNETWVYRRSEGDLLLHFKSGGAYTVGGDIQDYRLVRSLFDLGAQSDAQVEMLLASRAELLDVYGKILNWGGFAQTRALDREQAIVGTSIEVATVTDANPLHFSRVIQADAEALVVGTRADSSLVHLVFAIPTESRAGESGQLAVRLRASFYDATGRLGPTVERDTVLRARGRDKLLEALGHLEVPLPPGNWLYRVAVEINDSTGRVLPEDSIRVRPFDGSRLALSDLSLATRDRAIEWIASPQDTALFEPHPSLHPADQVELYFEVYGVQPEHSIRTEIRLSRGSREALHLSYQQEVAASPLRIRRTLDLNQVKPGRYTLEVRVVTSEGDEVTARREVQVGSRE